MNRACRISKWTLAAVAMATAAVVTLSPNEARAEDSAYCKKVRARAASDAALLIAPRAIIEGVRVPSGIQAGSGVDPTTGAGYQLRGGLTFSLLHAYKGFRVMDVAEADCLQHASQVTAAELLAAAPHLGRLGALREKAAYLDSQKARLDEVLAGIDARQAAQTMTIFEAEELRSRAANVQRERVEVASQIAQLETIGIEPYKGSIDALIRKVEAESMAFEKEAASVRKLDAFDLSVTGGYAPEVFSRSSGDFYGVVQLSYSFGQPWRSSNENKYVDARQEEMRTARQETRRQLSLVREQVKVVVIRAKGEIEILDRRIGEMDRFKQALEKSEAPAAAHAHARLSIELMNAEAERVFLKSLVKELSSLEGK